MFKIILLVVLTFAVILVYIRTNFTLMKVKSTSMVPTLHDGGIYIARKVWNKNKCKVGRIYSFDLNGRDYKLVKRLVNISDAGYYFKGDSENSIDSRYFGEVSPSHVQWEVVSTFDIREWAGEYGYLLDNALAKMGI